MRVHVLQHVPFEGIGSMADWLTKRDADIRFTRFYEGEALPEPSNLDLIIVMGGPMSVNDEDVYPWLRPEKEFLATAIRGGLPVVGICLGAQLIAAALGASVHANARKEIGWFPVEAVDHGADAFRFPPIQTVFHWHGETFDLPQGAVRLARSAHCANQAFQVGGTVIGLQFHLETTPASAREIVVNCRGELIESETVQSAQAILSVPNDHYEGINRLMAEVLACVVNTG